METLSYKALVGDSNEAGLDPRFVFREKVPAGMGEFVVVDLQIEAGSKVPEDLPFGIRDLIGKGPHALVVDEQFCNCEPGGKDCDFCANPHDEVGDVFAKVVAHCNAVRGLTGTIGESYKDSFHQFELPVNVAYSS